MPSDLLAFQFVSFSMIFLSLKQTSQMIELHRCLKSSRLTELESKNVLGVMVMKFLTAASKYFIFCLAVVLSSNGYAFEICTRSKVCHAGTHFDRTACACLTNTPAQFQILTPARLPVLTTVQNLKLAPVSMPTATPTPTPTPKPTPKPTPTPTPDAATLSSLCPSHYGPAANTLAGTAIGMCTNTISAAYNITTSAANALCQAKIATSGDCTVSSTNCGNGSASASCVEANGSSPQYPSFSCYISCAYPAAPAK